MTVVEVVQGIRKAPGPAINSSMSSTASTPAGTMTSFTDIVKIGRP